MNTNHPARSRTSTLAAVLLLSLPLVTVEFARAGEDDPPKVGPLARVGTKSATVRSKVGAGLSQAKTGVASVGAKVGGAGARLVGQVSNRLFNLKDRVSDVGTQVSTEVGARYAGARERATDLATTLHAQIAGVTSHLTTTCAALLTTTHETIEDTLVHTSDPWELGPDIETEIARVWAEAPGQTVAMREHVRKIFESRVVHASSKVSFSTVAETRAFQKTIGKWWSPEPTDYSDFLRDVIDPRFNPESLDASELFKLARELAQDFNERYDAIRSALNSATKFANASMVPLPGPLALRGLHVVLGPYLDHRNENARIGSLWEIARLLPEPVRARQIEELGEFIKRRHVPEFERDRFRRFVFSGEFERAARAVEKLQLTGVLYNKSVGVEQLLVRAEDLDAPLTQRVRDDLRRLLKPEHERHARVLELVGEDGIRTLRRVYTYDEYLELDNGGDVATPPAILDKQLERLVRRYQWSKLTPTEREGIEIALASLKNAHLPKQAFISELAEIHDNEFNRVVARTFLPDFLTKRAPRDRLPE